MRSSVPEPDNPWPHEMTIEVAGDPLALLELLWIREAWQLHPVGDDLPTLLAGTPSIVSREGTTERQLADWEAAWPSVWRAVVAHAATPVDHSLFDRVTKTADGSRERHELLARMMGPSWRGDVGDAALVRGYSDWSDGQRAIRTRSPRYPLEEQPERVALDALVPAWRAGLVKIVTISCAGEYTRVIGPHAMIMTALTRSDPDRFRSALGAFPY